MAGGNKFQHINTLPSILINIDINQVIKDVNSVYLLTKTAAIQKVTYKVNIYLYRPAIYVFAASHKSGQTHIL